MESAFHSYAGNVLLTKIWGPLICVLIAIGVFGKDFPGWRFLPAYPFLLAAAFGASVATIEVRAGVIRYRRFIRWKTIPSEEILESRAELPPLIASLRLNRFVWPWGRLYFALDRNLNPNPFRQGDYLVLRYLGTKTDLRDYEPQKLGPEKHRTVSVELVAAGILGLLTNLLWLSLAPSRSPTSVLDKPPSPGKPADWITLMVKALHLLNSFPAIEVLLGVFLFLTIYRWRHRYAWVFAFLAGAALGSVVFGWFAEMRN